MTETLTLPAGGSLPGIPGNLGPGTYIIDWETRHVTPLTPAKSEIVEEMAQLQAELTEETAATSEHPE